MKALVLFLSTFVLALTLGCSHHGKHGDCDKSRGDKSSCDGECKMKKSCDCADCKDGKMECKDCDKCKDGSCGMKSGAGHKTEIDLDKKIGATTAAVMNGHVYVSAAPKDMKDYMAAKEAGIKVIVDLRADNEFKKKDVQKAVTDAGLSYVHVPMSKKGKIQKDAIDKIELAIHADGKGQNAWIYCATSNRAAAWVAIHAAKVHGDTQEKALNYAAATGLKDDMKKKVQEYWKANP